MAIDRALIIRKMGAAIKAGWTHSKFVAEMREAGYRLYRRTDMLADWRAEGNIEKKTNVLKYVRKDYMPKLTQLAEIEYRYQREFIYKCKVHAEREPGKPLVEQFITVQSDIPLTPGQVETQAYDIWTTKEPYIGLEWKGIEVVLGMRRIA